MSHSVCTRLHGGPLESHTYLPQRLSVTFLHALALPPQVTMQHWHLEAPNPDAAMVKKKKSGKREQGACLRQTTKSSKVNAHHVWNREPRRPTWLHKARSRHPDRQEALQPLINAILWLITSSADVIFNDTSHQNASAWMDGRLVGG